MFYTVDAFRIMRRYMQTLQSGWILTDVPINAFFSLFSSDSIVFIDSSICALISKRTIYKI